MVPQHNCSMARIFADFCSYGHAPSAFAVVRAVVGSCPRCPSKFAKDEKLKRGVEGINNP